MAGEIGEPLRSPFFVRVAPLDQIGSVEPGERWRL